MLCGGEVADATVILLVPPRVVSAITPPPTGILGLVVRRQNLDLLERTGFTDTSAPVLLPRSSS